MNGYDLLVRGGTVVDGTGAAPFTADIAVRDGVIAAVGQVSGQAREEIDATGYIVTPGFVDVHTHYDGQITWDETLRPSSSHGVTTVVMGNCGVGFAPARAGDHELVIRLMEGVEDIPEVVLSEGVPWNWETFPDYLDALERRHADIDFAAQLPHSPLRVYVMGERGANHEPPTASDLAEMRRLAAEAVRAGALGISTSRNLFHRFRDGRLAPSVNTEVAELRALAEGLRDAGTGVFQMIPHLDGDPRQEVEIILEVARTSGRRVNFSLTSSITPKLWQALRNCLAEAAAQGLDASAQFAPRPVGSLYGLELSFHPFRFNPSYEEIADWPLADRVARMRDPAFRARLIAEEPEHPNPALLGIAVSLLNGRMRLYPFADPVNHFPAPEDVLDVRAEMLSIPYRELLYDELLKDDGRAILAGLVKEPFGYADQTAPLFADPAAIPSLGDGGAHCGMICDASYSTYLLTNRLGRHGLDLPTIVASLTSRPAASVGLDDRGVLAPGYKADLNVIALERLRLHCPAITADLPAGGKRLLQQADGYVATVVSGTVIQRDGAATGARPGRLVRGARPAPASTSSTDASRENFMS